MNFKGFAQLYLVIGVIVLLAIVGGAYLMGASHPETVVTNAATPTPDPSAVTAAGAVASEAYTKCVNNGGFVSTSRRGNWGYYNVCNFTDDMSCELYALYLGQCPVGGVKTIGYSTTDQVFCALRGGQPMGSENGQCKLPDGKICTTSSVYEGTCDPIN